MCIICHNIHMRTNIEINDNLLKNALEVTGLKTKRAVVEEGLRRIVQGQRQVDALERLSGMADWKGSVDELRERGRNS